MKHILPSTVARLTEEAFDGIANVPVCSILIRLLPYSEVSSKVPLTDLSVRTHTGNNN